ncbi:IS630 family transposase [Rhodococcus opacus]|uniref:IS630 family transposase n=1 Tax=Rhodococcus opacus TaxID=37919 RepID=A0AAX3Y8K5_RHOOP|nr:MULTISPECIES: IS630 family transposase [Rhodococcus]NHU41838.1 IS630 family transposase [Rhodococcus sp. A14]MCZ4586405.1 IS630 family transposase [Rhodococcus opacus]MDI9939573.1 IS630 family transposase [Rhodococcus sp. IEGM 1351]UZG53075.1 IS630 family transposase [Rhodococcus opacus]WKN53385.1 IS630 family transposase [Rhodococcus opacus]
MREPVPALEMSVGQREVLELLARSQSGAHREVVRAKALLMAADGQADAAIGRALSVSPGSVSNWRARFAEDGVARLGEVRKGRGRKASIPQETIEKILDLTQNYRPEGETHWSCRTMADAVGVSKDTVQRVWSARGLKPHRVDTFKLSNDPRFEEKLVDVVGLYLNPPEKAIVLCADEKSSVQALDRTQASLPMVRGRGETMTHDYKRHGTTTLFAALDVLTGMVIGQCLPRHRHQEFLKFLRTIDREVPNELTIHLILDNYATHKHPNAQAWLAKHPRFHLHFTPTSSSWLNLVERWFRELTDKALRRGVFHSVPDLIDSIQEYLDAHNDDPRPYVWTATAESILAKVARGRIALEKIS